MEVCGLWHVLQKSEGTLCCGLWHVLQKSEGTLCCGLCHVLHKGEESVPCLAALLPLPSTIHDSS